MCAALSEHDLSALLGVGKSSFIDCNPCVSCTRAKGDEEKESGKGLGQTGVSSWHQRSRASLSLKLNHKLVQHEQHRVSVMTWMPEIHVGVEEGFKRAKSSGAVVRIGSKDLTASKHDMVPIRRNDATLLND